jgi:MFS family permease
VATLLVFSISRTLWLSLATLFGAGVCQMLFMTTANTRIQLVTPDHLRGRVMALYAQAMMGVGPIGSTLAGGLSALFGPPVAMAVGAGLAAATIVSVRVWRPAVFLAARHPK